jgi:enoyl-CoA hydratase
MEYRHILYQPGKVARVIFNRPQSLNAQSYQMLEELDSAFSEAVKDPQCGCIVLSGAGKHFSVGHDIGTGEDEAYRKERGYSTLAALNLAQWFEDMRKLYVDFTLAWRKLAKPTVAMVHGYCIFGGWMLASAMDVVFAAEDAQFLPGFVEYFSVPWDLGPRRAKEILFEHRFITAWEAHKYGFVNRVFPLDALEKETMAYAERVADNYLNNTSWVRLCKFNINHMEESLGLDSEVEAAFNNFCLMTMSYGSALASPEQGGFARTKQAKKNLEATQPWLKKAGLTGPTE